MHLYEKTALELSRLLADCECTSTEIVKSFLTNIGNNADIFVTINAENALKNAENIDKKRKNGENLHAFAGIPFAVSDNISTKNIKTSCGSKLLESYNPVFDAAVIERLEAAGLILIGKTAMPEFGLGQDFTAMGVLASALNKGCAPLGIATSSSSYGDYLPAENGISCVFPTMGSVSRYGTIMATSFEKICPLARTKDELAVLLTLIAGQDERDSISRDLPFSAEALLAKAKGSVNVGISSGALSGAFENAEVFELDLSLAYRIYLTLSCGNISSNLAKLDGVRFGTRAESYTDVDDLIASTRALFSDHVKSLIFAGTNILSAQYYNAYYKKALLLKEKLKNGIDTLLNKYEVLAFPLSKDTENPVSALHALTGYPAVYVQPDIMLLASPFKEDCLFSFLGLN